MSGRILIVDDVATNRIVLKARLAAAWYLPVLTESGAEGLRLARLQRPEVILINHRLADMTGLELVRQLRADPVTAQIPVVYLAAGPDQEHRLAALNAGADDVMVRPFDELVLLARIRNLCRDASENSAEVSELAEEVAGFDRPGITAIVTARPETALAWRRGLAPHWPGLIHVLPRAEAMAVDALVDVIVLEADCSRIDGGLHLVSELRSRHGSRHAAICIVCSAKSAEGAAMAYDLGANQVVPVSTEPAELALRLKKLLRRKQHADRMRASVANSLRAAVTDDLTGLWNRRYATAHLPALAKGSHDAGLPYSVLMLDLDHFKRVNDQHGHAAGDLVLAEVARRFAKNLREGDLLARMGGEEFLVCLPDTDANQARHIAERLCRVVEKEPCILPDGSELCITVSIGIAMGQPLAEAEPVTDLVERADRALLAAKQKGRNQISAAQSAA